MGSLNYSAEKKRFREYYTDNYDVLQAATNAFSSIVESILHVEKVPVASVLGRVKDREECIRKFERKYQTDLEAKEEEYEIKDHITDLIGLRVVVLYEPDINRIREVLEREFQPIDVTDKIADMDKLEDSFGYKGLHLDLQFKKDRQKMLEYSRYSEFRFEIQIRTIIQDAWSVLDHKIKYKKEIPVRLKRRINTLAALFELADHEFDSIRAATVDAEQEAKQKAEEAKFAEERLNVFSFLTVADSYFQDFKFTPKAVDGFVEELQKYGDGGITAGDFKKVFEEQFNVVSEYCNRFSPTAYTVIRHMFYRFDSEKYERILYDSQRAHFDEWLKEDKAA